MEGVYKMNKIIFFFVLVIGLSFSGVLKAENVLYCQSELATGFIKDGQNWRLANYEQKRFTLKFNQDFTILKGVLPDGRVMKCSDPITIMPEVVSCIEEMFPWKPFLYYKESKRFTFANLSIGGYISQKR